MTTCEWRAILRNCPSGPPRPRSAQARCGFVRSLDTLLEVPNQLGQRRSDGGAPIPQLHEVQPALSALDIADKGLGAPELFRQLRLSQVCRDPGISQQFDQQLGFGSMKRL